MRVTKFGLEQFEKYFVGKTSTDKTEERNVLHCKIGAESATYTWENGMFSRIESDAEVDLELAISEDQASAFQQDGSYFSKAYMKGDFKPKGSMRVLLAWLSVLDL